MQLCLLSAIGYIPAELEAFEYGNRFHGEPPMKIQAGARYAPWYPLRPHAAGSMGRGSRPCASF